MVGTRAESQAFDALSNPHRRHLLLALFDADPPSDDALDPFDLVSKGGTFDDGEAIRIELTHTHLPKLAEMGFIRWEQGSGEVSKGPNWQVIAPLLALLHEHRDELPNAWIETPQ